jgi:hypothetical protein
MALENHKRIDEITPYASGSSLYDSLQSEGFISARLFLDWWLSEDNFSRLNSFMEDEFPGRSELLEKQSSHSFRYRIRRAAHDIAGVSPKADSPSGSFSANNSPNNNNNSNSNIAINRSNENLRMVAVSTGRRGVLRQSKNYSNPLIEIFEKLEIKKRSLNVQEYSVGQTTLEQIFNHFASKQDNPEVAVLNHQQQQYQQEQLQRRGSSSPNAVNPSPMSEKNVLDSPLKLRHIGSRDTAPSLEGESENNKGGGGRTSKGLGSKKVSRFVVVEARGDSNNNINNNINTNNGIVRNSSHDDEEQGSPVELFEYKITDDNHV